MTFAEKLKFLMNLTATSNKQLAEAVKVDPSLISLLRTGRRGVPKSLTHVRKMAEYFAKRCEGNYQRVALSEALGRKYLPVQMDTAQLAAIILDWLTHERDSVTQFLSTFERISIEEGVDAGELKPEEAKSEARSSAYYGNEGKRGAFEVFVNHLLSLKDAGTVLFSTDESLEWIYEDQQFLAHVQENMMTLIKMGFHVCRIAPPVYTTEQAFESISRLLPMFLTGQVESYFYPRLRDNVYKRTIAVLPGEIAVESSSIGNGSISRLTLLSTDRRITNALADEFRDYLAKCRPVMTATSGEDGTEAILRCLERFEGEDGDCIRQSASLSAATEPPELVRLSFADMQGQEGENACMLFERSQMLLRQCLEKYEVIDISSVARPEEVRAGKVPVMTSLLKKSAPVFYTPEMYVLHLKSILEHIEKYENYRPVLRRSDGQAHLLTVKDGQKALLFRPGKPLTIFEISQPYIAEACREYLMGLTETRLSRTDWRKDAVSLINELINELS